MGILDRVKAQIEVWRIEKYTKRRDVTTPDFERKDADYYRDHYQNGVYLSANGQPNQGSQSIGRRTTLIRKKSERIVRCSEVYNTTQ
ncbi:hypothetical protein INT43_003628 [Umbelopsis isabellina]|uniref:Uncharacterized protein n=1 Tax=Mortierella isabellina TaxID=91625 RepID=A0A8H7UFL3_MORIS|nr:hypothetical protein INT43_003628 [Umbelopsis isabellina]